MATFVLNTDITTTTPSIEVTVDPNKPLAIGRHRFRLVVVDDSGNVSKADEVEVIVADQSAPTAVLNVQASVASGASFELNGSKSFDLGGGTIVKYIWTYLGQP
ncbi:MAG TPA: hypothetical protein PKH69_02905 [Thiobacillaceae bacterium]|nr:hypothetical protein [Thiobacillaceae bacterium]HNU63036.1 hypothetical protein [Thiobacillaceae bacterium]